MYINPNALANALGGEARGNRILCPGPGHSKEDRSLSILCTGSGDGFIVHSFAGDDPIECKDYVRAKAGLPPFKPEPRANGEAPQGKRTSLVEAEYIYRNERGEPHLKVVRLLTKKFLQEHWNGSKWVSGGAKPLLPYRLPELLASEGPIFIVEGEKDADRLAGLGFVATTNPMGAGKWKAELNSWFAGRDVLIIGDNDEPGRAHEQAVAGHLKPVAASVRVVPLLGLPPKGDVSDWLDADSAGAHKLLDMALEAPLWEPAGEGPAAPEGAPAAEHGILASDLQHMEFPPIKAVVPGVIVEGCTIIGGRPKIGKSWLMYDVAIAVSTGGFCLGLIECEQGDVLYAALEDNDRRVKSRIGKIFTGLGDWPNRLRFWTSMKRLDDGGLKQLRDWIKSVESPRLIIIDVLAKIRPLKKPQETQYDADYKAIATLQQLASETGVAIVVVTHTRKADAEDPLDTLSGTLGTGGGADTIMVLSRTGEGWVLYGRGRDVEEVEVAVSFNKDECRWRILGNADEVHRSKERKDTIKVLEEAGEPMSANGIATALGKSRNSVDVMLYRMLRAEQVEKVERGLYQPSGKKER